MMQRPLWLGTLPACAATAAAILHCGAGTPPPAPMTPASATAPAATPAADAAGASAAGEDSGTSSSSVALDKDSEGKTIEIRKGQTLTLTLPSNPTTGYDWAIQEAPKALGEPQVRMDAPSSGMAGAGGKRVWTWTVEAELGKADPGKEHVLELVYRRPWEKGTAPLKTFRVVLHEAH